MLTRQASRAAEKDVIAQAAAELVRDGDRIMIEAGTTTAGIVRHLGRRRGVQIVTNSTLVFAHARHNAGITVIMTGGTFHRPSESLVGPVALRAIRDFNVRLAFVGTDGFTPQRGLTTQFAEGAEVIAAMSGQADEAWLVTDASKFGRSGVRARARSGRPRRHHHRHHASGRRRRVPAERVPGRAAARLAARVRSATLDGASTTSAIV
ncbi:DeoR/GlpR family DNA-binding transcription regulator [Propioniciclava tarda]|uniref:DeoR/GlpR family DNA-binding transcription regulator n=1 Tax=Propioniciclava tarda TaxID=433330 RepID=UPI0013F1477A|nr:DeoR/GlpR transcriptional regulator [Propioniciclava tarda]